MWILYSFLSASLETVRDVLGKKVSQDTDEYLTAFGIQFFGLLLLLPLVLMVGIPEIKPAFWWALLGGAITVPTGNVLYMKAVKSADISMVVPMLAFNPFFTALVAIFFTKTFPSFWGWLGILIVGVGLYILRLDKKILGKGILEPLLQVRHDSGALAMLGVALVWSFGANISKVLVINSSPLVSALSGVVVGTITLGSVVLIRNSFQTQVLVRQIKQNFLSLSMLGFAVGLSNVAMSMAFVSGFTPYVISIKRTNMIFSSVASKIFFKESLSKNKIFGILLMFSGLVLIILS
jgi:drug/metabolite transporter (DMT)-like permease